MAVSQVRSPSHLATKAFFFRFFDLYVFHELSAALILALLFQASGASHIL